MKHGEKQTHLYSLYINLISHFFPHSFSDWFSPIIALSIGFEHKQCRYLKTGKQNPLQVLIFKNQNFKRGFWLSVFSSIDYFQTGN